MFGMSLSRLGLILLLVAIFFALLTQRMMLTSSDTRTELDKLSVGVSVSKLPVRNSSISNVLKRFNGNSENNIFLTGLDEWKSSIIAKVNSVWNSSQTSTTASIPLEEKISNTTFASPHISFDQNRTSLGQVSTEKTPVVVVATPIKKIKQFTSEEESSIVDSSSSSSSSSKRKEVKKKSNRKDKRKNTHQTNPDAKRDDRTLEVKSYHEVKSPRNGSDIGLSHQTSLLLCPNQSKCIVPDLFLTKPMNIYFCKHPVRHGIRFYFLVREGLLLHPNVRLVDESEINKADYVIYLPGSAPWHLTECSNKSLASRLIVMDEFDGSTEFGPYESHEKALSVYGKEMDWYFMYFKRSYVKRREGKFMNYPFLPRRDLYPITYSVAEAYVPFTFNMKRDIEILCTLRGNEHQMTTRRNVQTWVAEYVANNSITNAIVAPVNKESRQTISKGYFQQMYNAKIIVTVNPANWEGDFRLWEAMGTGALVMVDYLFVPHGFPLIDGVHIVYFSNSNKTDLISKLDFYRRNPYEAKRVAMNGYLFAMKYHRTVSMIDYVLRSAHVKEATLAKTEIPVYPYTAQYLHKETSRQLDYIKKTNRPGVYKNSLG